MGIFCKKKRVSIEDFCRDFYDQNILNSIIRGIDAGKVYFEAVIKNAAEVDRKFSKITTEKLASAMIPLHFELFALAWMHKFVGKFAIAQSLFTKQYLHEKGRDDIWNGMEYYNKCVDGTTLNWLTSLGKINLSFWYHTREDLTAKNNEEAKKTGVEDEVVVRVNNRLCSGNAWKQKIILGGLALVLCESLGLNPKELNAEVSFRLVTAIRGLYEGVCQALEKIKIRD